MVAVKTYLQLMLAPRLATLGIPGFAIAMVTADIETRFQNILAACATEEGSLAVLELSREEADRYDPPAADLRIRMLVNACVRNSLLEDLHSVSPYTPELSELGGRIDSTGIKAITTEAIGFFQQNTPTAFDAGPPEQDFRLAERYPLTYKALQMAGSIKGGVKKFTPVTASDYQDHVRDPHYDKCIAREDIASGFNPEISPALQEVLDVCTADRSMFFIATFKHLSRNIEKVFRTLEFVLVHNTAVVTLNYVLTNGVVMKRYPLLPPAHDRSDVIRGLSNQRGLATQHWRYLRNARSAF